MQFVKNKKMGQVTIICYFFRYHEHQSPTCSVTQKRNLLPPNEYFAEMMKLKTRAQFLAQLDKIDRLWPELVTGRHEVLYGCEMKAWLETEEGRQFRKGLESQEFVGNCKRLVPRECFKAAASDTLCLRWLKSEAKPFERARYVDCVSLFPFIMTKALFPVGPMQILVAEETNALQLRNNVYYFHDKPVYGLVLCQVDPPFNLKPDAPFLPFTSPLTGKQIRALCRSCAAEAAKKCSHSVQKRILEVSITFEDLRCALELGYKMHSIKEAWVYTKAERLTGDFFNVLARLKLCHSGNESGSLENSEYADKINEEMNYEGDLKISAKDIKENPTQRQIVKTVMVSCLGSLGKHTNYPDLLTCKSIKEVQEVFDEAKKHNLKILSVNPFGTDWVLIEREKKPIPVLNDGQKSSIVTACYINAYARTWMNELVKKISLHPNAKVLCYECDAILFLENEQNPVPLDYGFGLGKLRDVLKCAEILSYQSMGTKAIHVCYKQNDSVKAHTRIRGLNLDNELNCDLLSAKLFDKFLKSYVNDAYLKVDLKQFKTKTDKLSLISKQCYMNYEFTNNIGVKRVILPSFDTRSFGHTKEQ